MDITNKKIDETIVMPSVPTIKSEIDLSNVRVIKEDLDPMLDEQERLINELDNEVNELIDDSLLNIKYMKMIDLVDKSFSGTEMASNAEYKRAESLFQILANKIIGGINE